MLVPLPLLWFLTATSAVAPAPVTPPIETYGTVKWLTERHDVGPKVELGKLLAEPHAHGLGSLGDLRGEITIVDGVAWLAYPPSPPGARSGIPRVVSGSGGNERAAFLVATHVAPARWRKVTLPGALSSHDLEKMLAHLQGLDHRAKDGAAVSFPFRIDGRFTDITLAIIDGRLLPAGSNGERSMEKANVVQKLASAEGTLIGFFSTADDAAFDHAGEHAHVHAVLPRIKATGHAQAFHLAPGATVFLP